MNVTFARLGMGESLLFPAVVVALAVVLFLNPVYQRTQGLVDRLFFRERLDIGRTMEQVADTMTTLLDLNRIVLLLTETVERLLHPHGHALLLLDADHNVYRPMGSDSASYLAVAADGPLARLLGRRPVPLTRERLAADPEFSGLSETALASLDAMGATLVVPVVFRGSVRGMLALGPKRAGDGLHHRGPAARPPPRQPERGGAGERARLYRAGGRAHRAPVRAPPRPDPGVHPDQPRQVRPADRPGSHRGGAGGARVREARGGRHRALRGHRRLHTAQRAVRRGAASTSSSSATSARSSTRSWGAGATSTRRRATGSW